MKSSSSKFKLSKAIFLALLLLVICAEITNFWPIWFPKTKIVVLNASKSKINNLVIEMPTQKVYFDTIGSHDYAIKIIDRKPWPPGKHPKQSGLLANGTKIKSTATFGGEGSAYKRVVYVIHPDGSINSLGNQANP